jgi:hypothetical protein
VTGTLIVSIVALGLSATTLTWQVAQFVLGASRPVVELRYGAHNGFGALTAPVRVDRGAIDFEELTAQGYNQALLAVQVQNRGRLAVSVMNWSIAFDNGAFFNYPDWQLNDRTPLPFRLEPGAEATWLCPADAVHSAAQVFTAATRARASVSLGTGRIVKSNNYIVFDPTSQLG